MVFRLSLGLWKLAFLHIMLHALYKSLLFLGCGSLMISLVGGQDSRFFGYSFGGIRKLCFYTRSISLVGFPFAVGFFSKDVILLTGSFLRMNMFCLFMFFLGCLFTVFYRLRLVFYGFLYESFSSPLQLRRETYVFRFSISLLWLWAALSGYLFSWFCVSDLIILVRGREVTGGVYLFFVGLLTFCLGMLAFVIIFSVFYLRMLTSVNIRSSFSSFSTLLFGDFKWMEYVGPRGLYSFLLIGNFFRLSVDWFIFRGLFLFGSFFMFSY